MWCRIKYNEINNLMNTIGSYFPFAPEHLNNFKLLVGLGACRDQGSGTSGAQSGVPDHLLTSSVRGP